MHKLWRIYKIQVANRDLPISQPAAAAVRHADTVGEIKAFPRLD